MRIVILEWRRAEVPVVCGTVEYISVIIHSVGGTLLWQPRKLNTVRYLFLSLREHWTPFLLAGLFALALDRKTTGHKM